MHKILLILITLSSCFSNLEAQTRHPKPTVKDSLSGEQFSQLVDQTLLDFYSEFTAAKNYDSIIDALEYEGNVIPDFSNEIYCERIQKINEKSSFNLACNATTLASIRFFAKNRRSFAKIVLGRSALYFEMYEQMLSKYDLPLELKYLSVIESGLRPQVKSPAGALGLWQFMYSTGKMYGLTENSYLDERMDPLKATDAACRYLKKLHDIYNDWNLALAAYNAGPGNVNKAIRRSGGKQSYWQIRPFLPRETQAYVPNFIAACYLLEYHAEHNIVPSPAPIHYLQTDTMCFKSSIHMASISRLVDWEIEDIKIHNPVYKREYIPVAPEKNCISGPLLKIGKLVSLEDSLYRLEASLYGGGIQVEESNPSTNISEENADEVVTIQEKIIYHKVRSGETMTKIATKYGVTNSQILKWNKLRSTRVNVGKVLKIIQKVEVQNSEQNPLDTKNPVAYDTIIQIQHTVGRNESLTFIASKYDVTVDEIKKWNKLTSNWLNIGQVLTIQTKIKLSKKGSSENKVEEQTDVKPVVTPKPVVEAKKYYTVKSGDLFNRIAQNHGLTQTQLQKLNPGVNAARIKVGQRLRVK